jgi:branched-chain amino acid transport system substrate-binding protein
MPPPTASRRTLLLAAAAAAPGVARRRTARAQGTAGAATELRFGALFPLSGPLALLGDECFRGLEMATEERNAAGGLLGRPVRLLRTDVTEPAQAQAEARRLANGAAEGGRPVALFGTLDTQLALAASQAAELAGMPYLELAGAGDALTERGFRMLFRACPRASDLARTALEAVPPLAALLGAAEVGALRLAVLHEDGPGPQALAAALEARIREAGWALVERAAYAAPPAAPELAAAVRRLRSAEAQVVLHAAGTRGTDAVPLFRALGEEGWRPGAVVGLGGGYPLRETAQAVGPALDGTLLADLPQPEIADRFAPGAAAFAEAYRRRYGAEIRSGHSLGCYAGALLFYDAVQRAGAPEPARVRAAILATQVADGGLPNGWGARFDERGQNGRARAVLLQWREGRLLTVLPAEAAVAPLAMPRPP